MNRKDIDGSLHISFCTTVCNRMWQFHQTFDRNMQKINELNSVEWVVLNYNSSDGLDEYMRGKLNINVGRLTYVVDKSGRGWHASVAKNIAHRAARGEVLVNLDCDNFVDDAAYIVDRYFTQGCTVLHLWSGISGDGTFGRIAIKRGLFERLGGYDEDFRPMGFQDKDLMLRAAAMGFPILHARCDSRCAIRNTKQESMSQIPDAVWTECNRENELKSKNNIKNGRLVANLNSDAKHPAAESIRKQLSIPGYDVAR